MLNIFQFFKVKIFIIFVFILNVVHFTTSYYNLGWCVYDVFNFNLITVCSFVFVFTYFLNRLLVTKDRVVLYIYTLFILGLYFLINTDSFFIFFIIYEFFLLLSALLFKKSSQNKRSFMVLFYFIFWTQLGSFFVFLGFAYVYTITKTSSFFTFKNFNFNYSQNLVLLFFFFFGFGIKLPLWPFSFWLSKTHVEANTSFSIFLSGILLKTACVGFFKLNIFYECSLLWFTILVVSFVLSSFSLVVQVDFKKLIAYSTIQEMSLLLLFLSFQSSCNSSVVKLFIILHILTTIQLFAINDIIYKKFLTRRTFFFYGTLNNLPLLSFFIITVLFFFTGLPFFLKFIVEFFIVLKVINTPLFFLIVFIIFIQYFSVIFFSKLTLSFLFGKKKNLTYDLCYVDFLILLINFFFFYFLFFNMFKFSIYH